MWVGERVVRKGFRDAGAEMKGEGAEVEEGGGLATLPVGFAGRLEGLEGMSSVNGDLNDH